MTRLFHIKKAVQCTYKANVDLVTVAKAPTASRSRRRSSATTRGVKTSRIELRATDDDRDLLDRAATALGTDRSSFLLAQGRLAAQRVLADRGLFLLDDAAQQEWEDINNRPARSLAGLVRLLERPSPFS